MHVLANEIIVFNEIFVFVSNEIIVSNKIIVSDGIIVSNEIIGPVRPVPVFILAEKDREPVYNVFFLP